MPDTPQKFREEVLKLGVISLHDQDTLWNIAKKCARTTGVPMGGAGVILVTVATGPVGISAVLVGFLSGLVGGVAMCTMTSIGLKEELKALLR